jgi:hypothetical protein
VLVHVVCATDPIISHRRSPSRGIALMHSLMLKRCSRPRGLPAVGETRPVRKQIQGSHQQGGPFTKIISTTSKSQYFDAIVGGDMTRRVNRIPDRCSRRLIAGRTGRHAVMIETARTTSMQAAAQAREHAALLLDSARRNSYA